MNDNKKALILVDIQNDFLPGGALGIADGDKIIPIVNQLTKLNFDLIIATKDWHPKNHGSFAISHKKNSGEHIILGGLDQILWPEHCIQGTQGAEFPQNLNVLPLKKVFYKGTDETIDSYSVFFDNGKKRSTGLAEFLNDNEIREVYLAGLATDYCVKFSVLDALSLNFDVFVIIDACRGINLREGDEKRSIEEMCSKGAHLIDSKNLVQLLKIPINTAE